MWDYVESANGRERNVAKWKEKKRVEKLREKKKRKSKKERAKRKIMWILEFVLGFEIYCIVGLWWALFDTCYEMRIELGTCCCGDDQI